MLKRLPTMLATRAFDQMNFRKLMPWVRCWWTWLTMGGVIRRFRTLFQLFKRSSSKSHSARFSWKPCSIKFGDGLRSICFFKPVQKHYLPWTVFSFCQFIVVHRCNRALNKVLNPLTCVEKGSFVYIFTSLLRVCVLILKKMFLSKALQSPRT